MDTVITEVCELLDNYGADTLVPLNAIKSCISLFEQDPQRYEKHIELLRSQIGVWGSDDTSMFSAQLVAGRLKTALSNLA